MYVIVYFLNYLHNKVKHYMIVHEHNFGKQFVSYDKNGTRGHEVKFNSNSVLSYSLMDLNYCRDKNFSYLLSHDFGFAPTSVFTNKGPVTSCHYPGSLQ